MIALNSKVRDSITGFAGVVVGRTEYLFGCIHILVQPEEVKDGKPVEACWFDEQRLTVTAAAQPPVVSPDSSAKAGGPALYSHSR